MNPPKVTVTEREAEKEEKKLDQHHIHAQPPSKGREERSYQEELAEQLEDIRQRKAGNQ